MHVCTWLSMDVWVWKGYVIQGNKKIENLFFQHVQAESWS